MKNFKKFIREAHLGNPLNEEDRATRVDKMLSGEYEDEDYKDSKRYDDVRAELAREDEGYDDEDIVIYDGEEHIIMRRDGNMIYIRPLEDSAILGKKDEIKVPARALAYKSDLDKMYDEYKPKDEVNEEISDELKAKYDDAAMDEYGKPFAELDIAQKQELMRAIIKWTGKEFETDFERRRRGDYSDDREDGMTDYQRRRMDEEFKKGDKVTYLGNPAEITFVGKDLMDRTYYSVSYDKGRGKTKASNLYNKDGEIKAVKEDMNDPVLMKTRAAQMKRDAMDKKDLENKSKRISADEAIDLRYELSILDKEREDILMRIEDIGVEMEQTSEPEGGPIADKLGERLMAADKELRAVNNKIIDIKDDLGDFDMNESVNEEKDYSKMHNVELNATYKKKFGVKDTKGLTRDELIKKLNDADLDEGTCGYTPDGEPRSKPAGPDLNEDDELNVNIDNANDNYAKSIDAESRSGAYESLQKSLREKLQERLK